MDSVAPVGVERSVRPRFGQSIRERRFDLGWTQARLAAAMGVRPSDITRWERGDSLPPAATVRLAARVLGASPELARLWLEEVGEAPSRTTAEREISVRLMSDEPPADPCGTGGGPLRTRPAPQPDPTPFVTTPAAAPGVVFPGYSPTVVYSSGPLAVEGAGAAIGRFARTSAVLVALGAVLWWALSQLGPGLSALFDLFGGPPDPGPFGG